jgi:hypothetical protein
MVCCVYERDKAHPSTKDIHVVVARRRLVQPNTVLVGNLGAASVKRWRGCRHNPSPEVSICERANQPSIGVDNKDATTLIEGDLAQGG